MSVLWTRFNSFMLVLVYLALLGVMAMLASGVRGGPLDPAGPPASTDAVREPGTPISSVPFAITQSGRYYLTRNVTGGVITINANDVVLDLGGFTMNGLGNGIGVQAVNSVANVSVENGTIRNYQQAIDLGDVAFGHIRNIRLQTSLTGGTAIFTQYRGVIEDCSVEGGTNGVVLATGAVMRRCEVLGSNGYGVVPYSDAVVEDSVIGGHPTAGIYTGSANVTIRNNRLALNGPGNNLDVAVINGTAVVIDNEIHCVTSVSATAPGQIITSGPGGEHVNIPRFAAGFCGSN